MNEAAASIERDRRTRILEGAMKVFLAYGFQRTTMDDIARAADLSRPALYLVFRNKGDIYRAIATGFFRDSLAKAQLALAGDDGFAARLSRAIDDGLLEIMAPILASEHGAEILDMKNSLAADLMAEWRQGFAGLMAAAISAEADARQVDLSERGFSADGLAALVLDGLEGMKMRVADAAEQRRLAGQLVRLAALAVQP
ncbi:TetR/AcrR family transcriptional regulator [Nitratireductor mangrovi]|nr:TetR/AcrR family transcriptional regulator [Nitratireductor mangrovi]